MKMGIKSLVIATMALLIVIAGVFFLSPRKKATPEGSADKARIIQADLATLANKDANPVQFYAALIREAEIGNPKAYDVALEQAHDPAPWIRAGCAEALAYVKTDKAFALQAELLQDKEQTVREHALRGLARRKDEKALETVKVFLKKSAKTPQDKIAAASAILRLSSDPKEKASHVHALLEQVRTGALPENTRVAALQDVVNEDPGSAELIRLLTSELQAGKSPSRLQELAIHHLSGVAPDHVRDLLKSFKDSASPSLRFAVVQALPFACPADRFSILRDVIENDGESAVWKEALRSATMMPGEGAREMISSLKGSAALAKDAEKKAQVDLASDQLAQSKGEDPCAAGKKAGAR